MMRLSWLDFCEILEVNHMSKVLLSIERGMSVWIFCGSQVWKEYRQISFNSSTKKKKIKKYSLQPQTAPQHVIHNSICSQFWAVRVLTFEVFRCNHGIRVLFLENELQQQHEAIEQVSQQDSLSCWDERVMRQANEEVSSNVNGGHSCAGFILLRQKFMYFIFYTQNP